MENYEKAEVDYMAGMKYKDIAKKYGTTINTVKSWKNRYKWNREKGAHNTEKGCTQKKKSAPAPAEKIDDGTEETLQNAELNPKWQLFCVHYSRTFNGAQSYQKVYGCNYASAVVNASKLLTNPNVRAEIERLKERKRQQIIADESDIVELQMRIACADIGEYVNFAGTKVKLAESKNVDTQLIQEVKQGKNGVSVKLSDRQKAIDWLTKYFLMHPENRYRAECERKRAEADDGNAEKILQNMQTIADVLQNPVSDRNIDDFERGQESE